MTHRKAKPVCQRSVRGTATRQEEPPQGPQKPPIDPAGAFSQLEEGAKSTEGWLSPGYPHHRVLRKSCACASALLTEVKTQGGAPFPSGAKPLPPQPRLHRTHLGPTSSSTGADRISDTSCSRWFIFSLTLSPSTLRPCTSSHRIS